MVSLPLDSACGSCLLVPGTLLNHSWTSCLWWWVSDLSTVPKSEQMLAMTPYWCMSPLWDMLSFLSYWRRYRSHNDLPKLTRLVLVLGLVNLKSDPTKPMPISVAPYISPLCWSPMSFRMNSLLQLNKLLKMSKLDPWRASLWTCNVYHGSDPILPSSLLWRLPWAQLASRGLHCCIWPAHIDLYFTSFLSYLFWWPHPHPVCVRYVNVVGTIRSHVCICTAITKHTGPFTFCLLKALNECWLQNHFLTCHSPD